jgi:UDPglucose--hexose-1-phosphate uridylyltransferase
MAVRPSDDPPNEAGWSVRVIPNKYPAVRVDVPLAPLDTGGLFERVPAMGAHELVIVSPEHDRGFSQIAIDHWDRVLAVCQHRMYQLWQTPSTQHVALFLNHGAAAGASREHPHMQIISAPVSAPVVDRMHTTLRAHFKSKQTCLVCDIIKAEIEQEIRIVHEDSAYITIAPFASRLPYEMWVVPRAHRSTFLSVPTGDRRRFAAHLKEVFARLIKHLGNAPFNAILHSARPEADDPKMPFHWHFEIAPRLGELAGLEWGSGAHINPVAPETVAMELRSQS